MTWYPWLLPCYQQIIRSHQAQRAHHALLIHAAPGMGEQALIYAVSRWIMCQHPQGQKSCGQCRPCQLMQAQTHPDFYPISTEAGKTSIGVEAVRKLTDSLNERARMGGNKLAWIDQAQQLSDAAANALLKTLEEPTANTWFLLSCQQPARLPATLRSRCSYLHLALPDSQQAESWLAQQLQPQQRQPPSPPIQAALRLSGGAPLAALQLLQDQADHRAQLCELVSRALPGGDWYSLLSLLDDDQIALRLHWLAALLLDALKLHALKNPHHAHRWLTNPDQQPLIAQLASQLPPPLLHWLLSAIWHCREQLTRTPGLNRELMLATLLLDWQHYQRHPAAIPPPGH